ncbi:pyruvate kinase [Peptostreptococcus russellii]|uniref:pyruvate kinase n=1 Tax=Peptostreptococcus russellii TaxID=215200 RepID=UPI001626F460|nr:pyruvate kinase [Peptostreptococcus russellii]MBC2578080.1 pyruvate kinase [Peptostreptococcus russellii]
MVTKLKKTKIVCTMGPATDSDDILRELALNGLNVCRFNFSHGSHEEHKERMDRTKRIREELNMPIAILLDTKGPEIRTGDFEEAIVLDEGEKFVVTMDDCIGNRERCTVSYKGMINDVKVGDTILIDDGLVALKITEIKGNDIITVVENSGKVSSKKGVNLPGVVINLPAITDKDISDIKFGIEQGIDFIAASFVRKASDVLEIRKILEENGADDIQIISKIESHEGVENIDSIIQVSDGIMIARGDMGVEIPSEEVPIVQKMIIRKCNEISKPVITATQMMDSMIRNPRPTRAEVTDVANAIYDGTDAIMLSGETAAGKYPIEAVSTMNRIALRTEETLEYKISSFGKKEITVTDAISHATCTTAMDLEAQAIITCTSSGYTTKQVSKFRPLAPIIAATQSDRVMRKLSLNWGTYPVKSELGQNTDEVIENSIIAARENGFVNTGDTVVVTAGVPVGKIGKTNLIKVSVIADFLGRGVGIGGESIVEGIARVVKPGETPKVFNEGDILVAVGTDKEMVPYMEKASAIVTETGGMTSHAAIAGINLGTPVVVSVKDITTKVKDGDKIRVEATSGSITRE